MHMPHGSGRPRYRSLSEPETLARFAHNLGEGIYITNEQGEILDANPAFLEIFGVGSLKEMKSYNDMNFVDAEVRRREVELLERQGSLRDRELQITRRDGLYERGRPVGGLRRAAERRRGEQRPAFRP